MVQAVRNLGQTGVAAMAISAVDIALWDLKAKILNLPLVTLLGSVRESVEVYGSGGFTSYSIAQLQKQFDEWAKQSIRKMKMKVARNPNEDVSRVAAAREAIGPECDLFVDANGVIRKNRH